MEYLIKVQNLRKSYGDFALSGVDLAVEPGSVAGFVGPNGAGKTTTLKLILGLVAADEGSMEMFGRPYALTSSYINELKAQVGVVFDACAFPASCTVKSVEAIGKSAYKTWDAERYRMLCQEFGLTPKKSVSNLSRGMGMKLMLAFALAHDAKLLILDEATAGLDPIAREEVLDILRGYIASGDRGVLMSTHITSDLEKIADTVTCINEGRVVFSLSKEDIVDTAGIAHCRMSELEDVLSSGFFESDDVRFETHGYCTDLLVPDRFSFARFFPSINIEAPSIEEYMSLCLKGETALEGNLL